MIQHLLKEIWSVLLLKSGLLCGLLGQGSLDEIRPTGIPKAFDLVETQISYTKFPIAYLLQMNEYTTNKSNVKSCCILLGGWILPATKLWCVEKIVITFKQGFEL